MKCCRRTRPLARCNHSRQLPLATCHAACIISHSATTTITTSSSSFSSSPAAPAPAADHSKLITAKGQWQCCREQQSGCTVAGAGKYSQRRVKRGGGGTQVCSTISSPHFIARLSACSHMCGVICAGKRSTATHSHSVSLYLPLPLSLSLFLCLSLACLPLPLALSFTCFYGHVKRCVVPTRQKRSVSVCGCVCVSVRVCTCVWQQTCV